MSSFASNRTSTLTRPADTSAYADLDLVATDTTAVSVAVPSFTLLTYTGAIGGGTGNGSITRLRLVSNHTTGLSAKPVAVRLWTAAPTYTNGDNGAYAVATGAAGYLGKFTGTFEQFADGAVADLSLAVGAQLRVNLASGTAIYWDLQIVTGFTPQSGKTFTLTAEVGQ